MNQFDIIFYIALHGLTISNFDQLTPEQLIVKAFEIANAQLTQYKLLIKPNEKDAKTS